MSANHRSMQQLLLNNATEEEFEKAYYNNPEGVLIIPLFKTAIYKEKYYLVDFFIRVLNEQKFAKEDIDDFQMITVYDIAVKINMDDAMFEDICQKLSNVETSGPKPKGVAVEVPLEWEVKTGGEWRKCNNF